jgi:hypothetical protein
VLDPTLVAGLANRVVSMPPQQVIVAWLLLVVGVRVGGPHLTHRGPYRYVKPIYGNACMGLCVKYENAIQIVQAHSHTHAPNVWKQLSISKFSPMCHTSCTSLQPTSVASRSASTPTTKGCMHTSWTSTARVPCSSRRVQPYDRPHRAWAVPGCQPCQSCPHCA